MKKPKIARGRITRHHGFALIVCLSLMVLLMVLVVGLLSLGAVSLRSSAAGADLALARANARMALQMAIAEIQKQAGADQVVTARASIMGEGIRQGEWTGAWAEARGGGKEPAWLVSGAPDEDPDPDADSSEWVTMAKGLGDDADVRVPGVEVAGRDHSLSRFGWWVSDEGTKARVDIEAPQESGLSSQERLVRAAVPKETGLGHAAAEFSGLSPAGSIDKQKLMTVGTTGLALEDDKLPRRYLHDLTTGGYGLPVDVKDGGMKVDLSTVFNTAERSFAKTVEDYFGASPVKGAIGKGQGYRFAIPGSRAERSKFFLSKILSEGGGKPVGPNWGNLFNYSQLYQNAGGGSGKIMGAEPELYTDIRSSAWSPYTRHQFTEFKDEQHVSSGMHPVISLLQVGFRLKAEPAAAPAGGNPRLKYYQVQVEMKPVIGLWNPYNIKLPANGYRIDWAVYPYMRLGIDKGSAYVARPRVWLREEWLSNASYPDSSQNRWFRLQTDAVDFEPGEFRLFSVTNQAEIGSINKLTSSWNYDGAFTIDLKWNEFEGSPQGKAGQPMVVEAGSEVWIGDLYIEDTQNPETARQFPGRDSGSSATWCTLKTAEDHVLSRYSDLWASAKSRAGWEIPEQLESQWEQTGQTAPRFSVEHLTASYEHMGTWAFKTRTTTEAPKADRAKGAETQTLRSWVDSNPRAFAINPRWDGSRSGSRSMEGWWFASPMIGGSHPGKHSDTGPTGRGMVAWGSAVGDEAPQTRLPAGGRFQGFGGASSSPIGGQTHVAVFEVPRAPLVSIGQFQHAELSRYNFEPSFVVGNSYANPRIPVAETFVEGFSGLSDFRISDISHEVNGRLWDKYFFSTLAPAYKGAAGKLDATFPLDEYAFGGEPLPNPRMVLLPESGDTSLSQVMADSDGHPAEAIASRIGILGAFNVNSTSKTAWKALLSSLANFEFPVVSSGRGGVSWERDDEPRFPRMAMAVNASGFHTKDGAQGPGFWTGFRKLDDDELDELAGEIVAEVRARGPFLSLAGFVNRQPSADDKDHQRKGALQAAIDRAINAKLGSDIGKPVEVPGGSMKSNDVIDASAPENQAAGHCSYLLQGDLLQALGPVIQPRSDYFRVRAVGEVMGKDGRTVVVRAVCEAFIQRTAGYLDGKDRPEVAPADLKSEINRRFGRRLEMVSFRWLAPGEV
ncbi:hypothetical protein [Luteolibacter marinus]|uniref:hypothetical protein n=1 Tax=Luteolibacter marinus TaxID=2776705 RepID=UPI001866857D|nr:hypothetical protein [Luteolibacter marinus]